jgi:hypothetical protein
MPQPPPDGLPVYRLLTGSDDDAFCRRVSEALELGYQLYGSPAVARDRDGSQSRRQCCGLPDCGHQWTRRAVDDGQAAARPKRTIADR